MKLTPLATLTRDLLRRDICYRYRPDQLEALETRGLGLPFTPERRTVETRGGIMIEEVIQTSFEPIVLNARQRENLSVLGDAWNAFFLFLQEEFMSALRSDPAAYAMIGNAEERRNAAHAPGYGGTPLPFVRLDINERDDDSFSVFDVNSSRPIGAGTCAALEGLFKTHNLVEHEELASPLTDAIADALLVRYAEWCETFAREPQNRPTLGIVIPETQGAVPDFTILGRKLKKAKRFGEVLLVDPEDLDLRCGQLIVRTGPDSGTALDVILRTVKPDIHTGAAPVLAEAYPNAACIVAPLWRRWLGNKLWFALATRNPLKAKITEALGDLAEPFFRSLPECGIANSGSVRFSDATVPVDSLDRREWVVKPASGSSARGMLIGAATSVEQWQRSIGAMSDSRLLFQRFDPPKQRFLTIPGENGSPVRGPFKCKLGVYIIDGKTVGAECHASPDSLKIHGGRNTLQIPVFMHKEEETVK